MKMKDFKKRKRTGRIMRRMAAAMMWIGILAALGTIARIWSGMSPIQGVHHLIVEVTIMMTAWVLHCLFCAQR